MTRVKDGYVGSRADNKNGKLKAEAERERLHVDRERLCMDKERLSLEKEQLKF